MSERPEPRQRVSAVRFPGTFDLPEAPTGASAEVLDAHRQSGFLLKSDLRLFEEGMRLQVRFANEVSHSSFRTHPYVALISHWSRTFLALADACLLIMRGSYGPSLPLISSACDCLAAQQRLNGDGMPEFTAWLAQGLSPNEQHKAIDVGLGRFVPGSYTELSTVHRHVSDLSQPNFGSTLLLVGPESNHQRLALAFDDRSFHYAWAQLTLGWLLYLCERQLNVVASSENVFGGGDERRAEVAAFSERVAQSLAAPDRCRIEEIEEQGARRYLLHNFRRTPGGAAKKLLL
jgi:hypothetical protein